MRFSPFALLALFVSSNALGQEPLQVVYEKDLSEIAIRSLESAYAAKPMPEILLTIAAVFDGWEGHCKESLATYRRFFGACKTCSLMPLAVDRFDLTIQRCIDDIDEEIALRESFVVPSASMRPRRKPADATMREVVSVLDAARKIDPAAAGRLFATLVEVGQGGPVSKLNELRIKGWKILANANATTSEILTLLERIKTVDFERHQVLLDQLMQAERRKDVEALNELRQVATQILAENSSGLPRDTTPEFGCRPNPQREWGRVTVSTRPWSQVFINGEAKGQSPVAQIEVLAGCATIRTVDPATGRQLVQNIEVRPNNDALVQVDLYTGASDLRYVTQSK